MKFLVLVFALLQFRCAQGYYSTYYMSRNCGSSYPTTVISDLKLKAGNPYGSGYPAGPCTMTLKAYEDGSRLIIKFKELNLFQSDQLELFDGAYVTSPKLGTTMSGYDSSFDEGYRTSGRYLTLRLNSISGDSSSKGFEAIVTEFHTSSCLSYEFSCCDTGDCIGYSLKDDGEDNCLDNSDEWAVSSCMNAGAVAGIVVGVILGVVIVITVVSVLCCKHYRARATTARRGVASVTMATTYAAPQQPVAYPVQQAAYPQQMPAYPPPQGYPPQQPPANYAPPAYNVVTQPQPN